MKTWLSGLTSVSRYLKMLYNSLRILHNVLEHSFSFIGITITGLPWLVKQQIRINFGRLLTRANIKAKKKKCLLSRFEAHICNALNELVEVFWYNNSVLPAVRDGRLVHRLPRVTEPMHSVQDVDFVDILRALLFVVNDAVCHVESVASLPAVEVRLETRDGICIHWLQDRCDVR